MGECPRLTVELDWRYPRRVLTVLLGRDVRRFLSVCASVGLRLIQVEPFVPFPSARGPVAVTLVGAAVRPYVPIEWGQIRCEAQGSHVPEFKADCREFPRPKVFVNVGPYRSMFGLGAYIEWLAHHPRGREAHFGAFVALMWRVFGEDARVRVHNADVRYFHVKLA